MSVPDRNGNSASGARTCLCRGTCYRNCNANVASGALFRFTPSFPFSATQNSNSFGSTTLASFGSTSSSPFFGTQNSSPFGNAVGGVSNVSTFSSPFSAMQSSNASASGARISNGSFGASFGSTSSSPFLGTQNSSPFGNAVGGASNVSTFSSPLSAMQSSNASASGARISNGSFGAFNDYTSAYGVTPNQSSMPFGFGTAPFTPFPCRETSQSSTGFGFKKVGCPAGTNTSPFAQPSSSFPGFGGAANTSPFVQTPPRFGEAAKTSPFGQTPSVFGGFGATSTTPVFGESTSIFSTSRGASSTTPTSTPQPWTTLPSGGGGPAITDNSCEGTRCAPYRPTPKEDNLSWNDDSRDVLTSISAMNCYCNKNHEELRLEDYKQIRNRGTNPSQPANSPGWFPPSDFAFKRSSENPFQKTGGSPAIVDNSCGETRAPYQPTPAEENNLPWNNGRPVLTSISAMNCYCNNSHEELRLEDYKQTRNGAPSMPFSFREKSPSSTGFGSTNTSPFGQMPPRYGEDPSTSPGSDKNPTTPVQTSPVQTSPVVQTSVAQTNPAVTTSHVSPSAVGDLGSAPPPTPTNTAPFGSSTSALFDFFKPVTIKDPSLIPKGLEMIVEHLGFNPWEGKNNLKDSQATTGDIIDAFDDPDILSLAEFAVEQHNAMHQDGKVELLEVTAACLEAVDGGSRYHIILQAEPPASFIVHPTCFYAAVFRKNTDRRTPLIVLERWLYSRWSFRSSSSFSRSSK